MEKGRSLRGLQASALSHSLISSAAGERQQSCKQHGQGPQSSNLPVLGASQRPRVAVASTHGCSAQLMSNATIDEGEPQV